MPLRMYQGYICIYSSGGAYSQHHMQGFRKYAKIRETLVHELTHNVWSDHDNNFKTLNSQLLRQCIRMSQARILGADLVRAC